MKCVCSDTITIVSFLCIFSVFHILSFALLVGFFAMLVYNWRVRRAKVQAASRQRHQYDPKTELNDRSQLEENVRTTRSLAVTMSLMFLSNFVTQGTYISNLLGLVPSLVPSKVGW